MNTTIDLPTAEQWRELARGSRRSAAESFERCDTDGFLSQWASTQMAGRYDTLARLAEQGYRHDTLALFLDGELASLNQKSGQYGLYWVLNDAAAEKFGKRFFNGSRAKDATERDRRRGFTYGTINIPVRVSVRNAEFWDDRDALASGDYTVVRTDGAYDGIDEMFEED